MEGISEWRARAEDETADKRAREAEAMKAHIERLSSALRAAMDDVPGWYDLAREALAG